MQAVACWMYSLPPAHPLYAHEMPEGTLVLVHGAGSGPAIFDTWRSELQDLTVVTPDLHQGLDIAHTSMGDYADRVASAIREAVRAPLGARALRDIVARTEVGPLTNFIGAIIQAEQLGVSGVLAAVTTGLYLGWMAPHVSTAQMRIQGFAVWELIVFLLNAVLFVLIGLQLPGILDAVSGIDV